MVERWQTRRRAFTDDYASARCIDTECTDTAVVKTIGMVAGAQPRRLGLAGLDRLRHGPPGGTIDDAHVIGLAMGQPAGRVVHVGRDDGGDDAAVGTADGAGFRRAVSSQWRSITLAKFRRR